MDVITAYAADLAQDRIPARPFVLVGQMNKADPTRSPAGTETVWAYSHVPFRVARRRRRRRCAAVWDASEAEAYADRLEAEIEAFAPGFRALVTGRHLLPPPTLERSNANLVGGALGGGTTAFAQQLVFRPIPGLGRAETPVRGLFLASSSAHPGGGVHGACGANAARAALFADRVRRVTGRAGAARPYDEGDAARRSVEVGELAEGAPEDGEAWRGRTRRPRSTSAASAAVALDRGKRAPRSRRRRVRRAVTSASVSLSTASVSACTDS